MRRFENEPSVRKLSEYIRGFRLYGWAFILALVVGFALFALTTYEVDAVQPRIQVGLNNVLKVYILPIEPQVVYQVYKRDTSDPLAYNWVGTGEITWSGGEWAVSSLSTINANFVWHQETVGSNYLVLEDKTNPVNDKEVSYLVTGPEGFNNNPEGYSVASAFPPRQNPHGGYTENTKVCTVCHGLHSSVEVGLVKVQDLAGVCFTCHDGSGSKLVISRPDWETSSHALSQVGQGQGMACNSCHDTHGKDTFYRLTKSQEENGCLSCHQNVDSDLNLASSHPVKTVAGRHLDTETLADLPANDRRHSECVDCHDPHSATKADPTRNVSHVTVDRTQTPWYTWSASGALNFPADGFEYRICYKCHSGYWNKPGASDKALEFNPANPSYHPVEAAGQNNFIRPNAFTGTDRNGNNWSYTSRTMCSDCHKSGVTGASPHGSQNSWILSAPYPVTGPMTGDEICFNCHNSSVYLSVYSSLEIPGPAPMALSRFWGDVTGEVYQQPLHRYHVGVMGNSCRNCHTTHGSSQWPRLLWTDPTGPAIQAINWPESGCQTGCHTVQDWVYWRPAY